MGEVSERRLASEKTSILELLPHELNKMKNSIFRRLLPKDFDVELLKQLTDEGRVFIEVPRTTDKDAYKREVLDYVVSIAEFATAEWREDVDNLWKAIVESECFRDFLAMKKGACAGHINRYAVTNLVCRLQNSGVYNKEVSLLTLHLRLEKTDKRNKYYGSSGNYPINIEARRLLKQLLARV